MLCLALISWLLTARSDRVWAPHLQELATDVKAEVKRLLLHHGISQFRIRPVRRDYAFEQAGVPHGQQWVLKICYAGTLPQLLLGLSGGCQL